MNELVSIIVPIYNVRSYLERCIKSILNQTYKNLEIIMVDDGSTDGSSEICAQFQKNDERIYVIHKENGGLVSARKAGLNLAKGEYVLTVDSDDWIEKDMIREMVQLATANYADIVTSGYYRDYEDTGANVKDMLREGLYETDKEKRYLFTNLMFWEKTDSPGILPNMCGKLIRLSLLKNVYLKMNDSDIYAEDAATIYSCCVLANKIIITHTIYYHYIMRSTSIVHTKDPYYFRNINNVYLFIKNYFEKNESADILLSQLDTFFVRLSFLGINQMFGLRKEVGIPYYDFPKEKIAFRSKIVLYGAGSVGQSYYKQIQADKIYELVIWVDQNYWEYQQQGLDVKPIKSLTNLCFDYVLLALKYPDMAEKVRLELISHLKIDKTKILWFEPISIINKYKK